MPRFQRQVNFKINEEDHALLEAAKREHGSYQAGIIAGLRALEQRRLAQQDPPGAPGGKAPGGSEDEPPGTLKEDPTSLPAPPAPDPEPQEAEEDWWVSVPTAASFTDVSEANVRRWVRDRGPAQTRKGEDGSSEIRLDTLEVPRHKAAELLGFSSQTLGRRVNDGRSLPPTKDGYHRLGDLDLALPEAAKQAGVGRRQLERAIDNDELHSRTRKGQRYLPLIDLEAWIGAKKR